jgi:hypothetical protein
MSPGRSHQARGCIRQGRGFSAKPPILPEWQSARRMDESGRRNKAIGARWRGSSQRNKAILRGFFIIADASQAWRRKAPLAVGIAEAHETKPFFISSSQSG